MLEESPRLGSTLDVYCHDWLFICELVLLKGADLCASFAFGNAGPCWQVFLADPILSAACTLESFDIRGKWNQLQALGRCFETEAKRCLEACA